MGRNYIIITPAKNEEKNLPLMADSMLKQTIKPIAWFIIDDGSDDGTPGIIEELAGKFHWIHSKRLEKSQISNIKEQDIHFFELIKETFDYAADFCTREGLEYEYIGQVDADMILPADYFEKIIEKFEQHPMLGIAGGHYSYVMLDDKGNITQRKKPPSILDDGPSGGCMLIRRDCFQGIGGIPLAPGQDGATLAKARLGGWETRRFHDIEMLHLRRSGSAKWIGYVAYCLDLHPLLVLVNGLVSPLMAGKPLRGLAYSYGYLSAFFKREPKVTDQSLRYYFRHQRLKEVRELITLKIRNTFKNLRLRK